MVGVSRREILAGGITVAGGVVGSLSLYSTNGPESELPGGVGRGTVEDATVTVDDSHEVTVAVIPDTQYYSANDNGIFERMTRWIADNQDTYNIQGVLHEGDLVHNFDSAPSSEWDVAENAIDTLDSNDVPAVLAAGNHDAADGNPRDLSTFRTRFPESRYREMVSDSSSVSEYGTYDGNPENAYVEMDIFGDDYLLVTTEFGPRDAVVSWVETILEGHPEATALLVTHSFLFNDGTRVASTDDHAPGTYDLSDYNNGEDMWASWSGYDSLGLVTSGHHISMPPYDEFRTDDSTGDGPINQMYHNYQDYSDNGGDGWFRLIKIDGDDASAEAHTYSPYLDAWNDSDAARFDFQL